MAEGLQIYVSLSWLCWITPIIGALMTPLLAKIGHKVRDYGAVAFSLASAIMALLLLLLLFYHLEDLPIHSQLLWVEALGLPVFRELKVGVLLDPLSIIMANVVAVISFLIMVYSLGYMHGEEGLTRYWFFMNFFIGNMLLLVLSDNLLQMLFGWEGVGLCSYGLIGFWYRDSDKDWLKCWVGEKPEAYPPSHCGMKAFMFTRLGDLLLLVGILIIYCYAGTLDFLELKNGAIRSVPIHILLIASLFLLGGPIGKSAQLPLMEWLPDAMAGPTSVSALIHAATMVKAGVYLVARMFPILYWMTWEGVYANQLIIFFYVVAWIGALTAFVAATQAIPATELKKVLAYSTVSQLGYMMLGLGVAGLSNDPIVGYTGAVFHLVSHALFKAALFLSAGAIIHAVHSRFMYHMGGLRKHMPKTFLCMLLASFSLMGVPLLFSGFWSKDMVLEAALLAGEPVLFAIGVVTAGLTCFYTVRMIGLVFFGEEKVAEGEHVHEAPSVMLIPYAILVAFTILLGVLGFIVGGWLESIFHGQVLTHVPHLSYETQQESAVPHMEAMVITMTCSIAMLIIGAYSAYRFYVKRVLDPSSLLSRRPFLGKLRSFFYRRWYINTAYYKLFIYPSISFSNWFFPRVERGVIDGFNRVIAVALVKFSNWFFSLIERNVIDGFNYILASVALKFSESFRKTHTGRLDYNVLCIVVGLIFIFLMLLGVLLGW
jgi:NADH-quinone oxidoreductase subunit L